jgi:flagellin
VGSGFLAASTFYGGFIKLEAKDTNPIRMERGNLHASSPGAAADLAELGFRETTSETDDDAYTLTGIALSAPTGEWSQTDITINGTQIYDADIDTDSNTGKLDALNNFSKDTGVVASAWFEKSYDMSSYSFDDGDRITINGTTTSVGASIGVLVTNIGDDITGMTATRKGDNIILSGAFQEVEISAHASSATAADSGAKYFGVPTVKGWHGSAGVVLSKVGGIRLDSTANQPISIELGDSAAVGEHGFLEANVGAADYEVNAATLGVSGGSTVAGLSISKKKRKKNKAKRKAKEYKKEVK